MLLIAGEVSHRDGGCIRCWPIAGPMLAQTLVSGRHTCSTFPVTSQSPVSLDPIYISGLDIANLLILPSPYHPQQTSGRGGYG